MELALCGRARLLAPEEELAARPRGEEQGLCRVPRHGHGEHGPVCLGALQVLTILVEHAHKSALHALP